MQNLLCICCFNFLQQSVKIENRTPPIFGSQLVLANSKEFLVESKATSLFTLFSQNTIVLVCNSEISQVSALYVTNGTNINWIGSYINSR